MRMYASAFNVPCTHAHTRISLSLSVILFILCSANVKHMPQFCLIFHHVSVFLLIDSYKTAFNTAVRTILFQFQVLNRHKLAKFERISIKSMTLPASLIWIDWESKEKKRQRERERNRRRPKLRMNESVWSDKNMNGMVKSEIADLCQKRENLFWQLYYEECINAHFRARISQTLCVCEWAAITPRHYFYHKNKKHTRKYNNQTKQNETRLKCMCIIVVIVAWFCKV